MAPTGRDWAVGILAGFILLGLMGPVFRAIAWGIRVLWGSP